MEVKETKKGRPVGKKRSSKRMMSLVRKVVEEYKQYLPEHYSAYIAAELESMNYPLSGEKLKRKIQGVIAGNIGDGLIALAIKKVGKRFKEAEKILMEELDN